MRDRIEVLRQVRIDDFHITLVQASGLFHGLVRPASGPKGERARMKVRLEDRHQHQVQRRLHHPVFDRRDAQRALPPPAFGIFTRRTGQGRYVWREVLRAAHPAKLFPPAHRRRAPRRLLHRRPAAPAFGFHAPPCRYQHVGPAVHRTDSKTDTPAWTLLSDKGDLQLPDFFGC